MQEKHAKTKLNLNKQDCNILEFSERAAYGLYPLQKKFLQMK